VLADVPVREGQLSLEGPRAVLGAPSEQRELDVLHFMQTGEGADTVGRGVPGDEQDGLHG
jgi:hypothetical protein